MNIKTIIKQFLGLACMGFLLLLANCQPQDEIITHSPEKSLRFSEDTILFDTVFTQMRTATRRMKVYNPNKNAVVISSVQIAEGNASPYSITVNGQKGGKVVNDIEIKGGDSILVLVEANVSATAENSPFIIENTLQFVLENQTQEVKLLAWGQNATYYRYTQNDNGFLYYEIADGTHLTATKPTVLYNHLYVPKGCTLTVDAGAIVHCFKSVNIFVEGTILLLGTANQPVTFTGTRLEVAYKNQPDQWGAIVLLENALGVIDHAILHNGLHGVQVNLPTDSLRATLQISNTEIRNMSGSGVWSFGGAVFAWNNEITDCAQYLFAGLMGGHYELYHNTLGFSNNISFQRKTPAVGFNDFYKDEASGVLYTQTNYPTVKLFNNIISGNQAEELIFGSYQSNILPNSNVHTEHNVIRSKRNNQTQTFDTNGNFLIEKSYSFRNAKKYNFGIDSLETIVGKPRLAYQGGEQLNQIPVLDVNLRTLLQTDKAGNARPLDHPDIGAYQYKD
ncbi:hypothetical protein SAMN05421780_111102 [Flexibacter flexilis DSM 6793]|uniref:Right handed beta helix region n=1 Tax=Flexibacter flexilis DSM 6793 TaxID=927664 RepID=A0A1I1MTP6_9BACT|nr:hypothetical protein [Flexibacter flexilis]SFC88794.1 hypothetical protein SAMN05421780_111102 [Flexibacter flexilis DSM 6793]